MSCVLCRASDAEAVSTAAQTLVILVDIPHTRQDALAAGAVPLVTRLLGPAADDTVSANEELAAVLLSKLALEPEAHSQIAAAAAIPVRPGGGGGPLASCCHAGRLLRRLLAVEPSLTFPAFPAFGVRRHTMARWLPQMHALQGRRTCTVKNAVKMLHPLSGRPTGPTGRTCCVFLFRQVLARVIAMARDAGRERMLIGVLRTLGAVSESSAANASKVIAARGLVPAFQLLGSRLPAVRQVAPLRYVAWLSRAALGSPRGWCKN